jgi:uncharacterized protein YggE
MLMPIAFAAGALVCATVVGAQTIAATTPDFPVVVVTGEAVVKRSPDRAFVSFAAESRADVARGPAVERGSNDGGAREAQVRRARRRRHPDDRTDIQPRIRLRKRKQTLRDYVARNSIEARVDDLPSWARSSTLPSAPARRRLPVSRFDLKDRSGAEQGSLQRAVETRGRGPRPRPQAPG